jgi:hypothetical protein
MKIQERIVSVKRHTIGYVVSGQEYTRLQTTKLARQGKLRNVRVVKAEAGPYVMGSRGNSLYDLPTCFGSDRRFANKRSK